MYVPSIRGTYMSTSHVRSPRSGNVHAGLDTAMYVNVDAIPGLNMYVPLGKALSHVRSLAHFYLAMYVPSKKS